MKKLISGNSLAKRTLLLAGVLAVACTTVWAQNDAAPPAGQMRPRGGNPERELQMLTHRLDLTADQQAQVKTLLTERTQKMEALRGGAPSADAASAPPPPRRGQMEAIRNDTDTKITALLNDDQKAKFAALQQERKERMEHRQGPGSGGDNAPPPPPPPSGL